MNCHRCGIGLKVVVQNAEESCCVLICMKCVQHLQMIEGKLSVVAKATQLLVDVLTCEAPKDQGIVMPDAAGGQVA